MAQQATMTAEQRKSIIDSYFKRLDQGAELMDLFAENAQVYFPKWGVATGTDEIGQLFADLGSIVDELSHDYAYFNYAFDGDTVVVEGTSTGETSDGVGWRADDTPGAGRWCDVFEVRDGKIQRLFIYLDPDYAGDDTDRYPWLQGG